jgi:hypothetical protein
MMRNGRTASPAKSQARGKPHLPRLGKGWLLTPLMKAQAAPLLGISSVTRKSPDERNKAKETREKGCDNLYKESLENKGGGEE